MVCDLSKSCSEKGSTCKESLSGQSLVRIYDLNLIKFDIDSPLLKSVFHKTYSRRRFIIFFEYEFIL